MTPPKSRGRAREQIAFTTLRPAYALYDVIMGIKMILY